MHVILIVIDTLRADHLSCYGYARKTSPNIDSLAEEGILFENHISTAAHTTPAFTSIFTGQNPFHHGIVGTLHAIQNAKEIVLDDLTPTLSDILYQNGYITTAFDNLFSFRSRPKWHSRGFKYYVNLTPIIGKSHHLTADEVNGELMPWVKNMVDLDNKYFLFVHYWDPHQPYNQPNEYRNIFTKDLSDLTVISTSRGEYIKGVGLTKDLNEKTRENIAHYEKKRTIAYGDKRIEEFICLYDEEIMYVDKKIGEFIETLKSIDMYDKSLIIVVGDHGEGLAEHKCYDHAQTYEGTIRVPLIIKPSKNENIGRSNKKINALSSHADIMPTILEWAGIPFSVSTHGRTGDVLYLDLDGKSLIPLITGETQEIHPYVISTGCYFLDNNIYKSIEVCVRTNNRKLIFRSKVPPGNYGYSQVAGLIPVADRADYRLFNAYPKLELIDLANDSPELNNIADKEPEKVRELLDYLESVIKSPYFYNKGLIR